MEVSEKTLDERNKNTKPEELAKIKALYTK